MKKRKATPFGVADPVQNSLVSKAIIEARCRLHPKPRRYVLPLGWLASRVSNTVMVSSISCAGS